MSLPVAQTNDDISKYMIAGNKFRIAPELIQIELPPRIWPDENFANFVLAISDHKTMKALYLTGSCVSNAQYYALFAALKTHPSLKRLFLSKFLPCENHELVIERFSQYMQQNTVVRVLDLSSNYFRDMSSIQDITKIIEVNRSLKTLHLSAVSLSSSGLVLIANSIKKNTTLTELNLSFNWSVGEWHAYEKLFEALENNTTLLKLDVTDMGMHEATVDSLCRYLKRTRTLLCLRGNFWSTSVLEAPHMVTKLNSKLKAAFEQNTSLLSCQMDFMKRDFSCTHLADNYKTAKIQRNSIIITCITFARRLEDILNIFPMEIWMNIFRFITMWSRRYLRMRSSHIFAYICDNIGTVNAYLAQHATFRFVQMQKRNYVIKKYA